MTKILKAMLVCFCLIAGFKMAKVQVNSDKVKYSKEYIEAEYRYETTQVEQTPSGSFIATPQSTHYRFKTERKVCNSNLRFFSVYRHLCTHRWEIFG